MTGRTALITYLTVGLVAFMVGTLLRNDLLVSVSAIAFWAALWVVIFGRTWRRD